MYEGVRSTKEAGSRDEGRVEQTPPLGWRVAGGVGQQPVAVEEAEIPPPRALHPMYHQEAPCPTHLGVLVGLAAMALKV